WAWGWNGYNQLGDGTATQRNSPVRVVGLKNITGISAGALHGLASDITGRVWAWGWNGVGQLGDGSATSHPLPGLVPGLQGIKKVSAGFAHSLAVGQDGRLHSWGWNIFGQLGDGTGLDRYRPVVTGTGMQDASAGVLHSLGVKNDEVYGWGWNGLGTVGDGSTTDRRVPTLVLNTHVTYVAAGAYHSLASGDPAP
ncbi:MAG TPA: RCC1 repeat-containing protein, partial [Actinomycetota bacterium]|nr:RCC1 repeat-containing protein [Actinomycetota bacterium]